jgi:hypothetical protein
MGSTSRSPDQAAAWTLSAPSAYDIATAYYPEDDRLEQPGPKLRPCLVMKVLRGKTSGTFACQVAYGTKELKIIKRQALDLIIQNTAHVNQMGMARPTRFDLDCVATLPWNEDFFGCWQGKHSPVIGSLTEHYIREYAFLMMKRTSV